MSLSRIAYKLYNQPWLIKEDFLHSMQKQYEAYVKCPDKKRGYDEDEMPEDCVPTEPEIVAEPAESVAVIDICGPLGLHMSLMEQMCGGCDYYGIREQVRNAMKDTNIKSVVLNIDSPGGMVTGCKETADMIAELAAVKPVYAMVEGLACSAAYWLASQATAIYCAESAEIGSIGCMMTHASYARQLEDEGIKTTTIKSNTYKDIGSPLRDMTEEEYNIMLESVKNIETQFIAAIQSKRQIDTAVLNGLTHDGNKAVELGFADGIVPSLEDLVESLEPMDD